MTERLYYIDAFSDEVMPCMPELGAWALWLSKPAPDWKRHWRAAEGQQFAASVMRIEEDIVATRTGDGWSFSRDVGDADFVAIRFGQGLGWDAETIMWGDLDQALREWFADTDNTACRDRVEYVAVGFNEPDVLLTFHAGPPPSMTIATVQ